MKAAWTPQPGPQADAISATWCEELLFGGARGGGKSDFLLGDFLQDVQRYGEAWSGVIFRRTVAELDDLKKRAHQIYPLTGAKWQEQKGQWIWPNKAVLRMRHLERPIDAERYRGHAYCVGVDTPILMGDGSSKSIVNIQVGDEVQTLSGPRVVTDRIEPYEAECVEAKNRFGSQIQPVWHPVLTDLGWQSYASALGSAPRGSDRRSLAFHKRASVEIVARLLGSRPGRGIARFLGSRPGRGRLRDLRRGLEPFQRTLDYVFWLLFAGGSADALPGPQRALGSRCRYLLYPHLRDEQPLFRRGSGQGGFPLLGDVERQAPFCHMLDEEGGIPSDSRLNLEQYEYSHPYTDQVLQGSEDSFYEACKLTPIGKRLVTDITVAGVNHYVNANNFLISKNTWIGWDELTQWYSSDPYTLLRACLRSAHDVPDKRIRASANPGGPGHQWVKEMFVDPYPLGSVPIDDPETKAVKMFIRSFVTDNKILLKRDPGYVDRLKGVGSPELVRAWLEGDWTAVSGAFFPEFDFQKHVIAPFSIPRDWTRFRAIDWGYASPFCVLWFAVSDGSLDEVPRNALVVYREWYGSSGPNKGLRLNADQVADGILKRSSGEDIRYTVIDPSVWKQDSGPSIAEQMRRKGVFGRQADNTRLSGWDAVRRRLIGQEVEKGVYQPGLYIFSSCSNLIRTFPLMQHDEARMEDLDTTSEDHALDTLRYGCMSRPYVTETVEVVKKPIGLAGMTWNDLINNMRPRKREVRY